MFTDKTKTRGDQKLPFLSARRKFILIPVVLAAILLFGASFNTYAATFVVNSTTDANDATAGDGICATAGVGDCTLRAAITEANALAGADIITLPAGTYTIAATGSNDNTNAAGDYDLNTDITINGAGSGTTIVQAAATAGTATERVFHCRFVTTSAVIVLNDITVQNGRYTVASGTFGAGIRVDSGAANVTLNRVVVTNNQDGTSGGGIAVSGAANATLTINNSTISNNTAGGTAAGSSTGAGIMGNVATATININNSTITGNTVSNTSTTISPSGGGLSSIGILNVTGSTISNNTATSSGFNAFSGGLHITGGTATITGSLINNNSATITGGTGSALVGGVYNQQATVTLTNTTVSNNSAQVHAGVRTLASAAATTNIIQSAIVNNTSIVEGSGVVNASVGAAAATTNINNSTIGGNTTAGSAGGVENFNSSTGAAIVNINYSTVAGNAANTDNSGADGGGGIGNFGGGTGASTVNLQSSIVADNTIGTGGTGPDIFGTITSLNYNHIENTTGGTFTAGTGDVTGTDPALTPLALNGGTTLNYQPGPASPVLNTIPSGTNSCGVAPYNVDQINITRPTGTGCEKGSREVNVVTAGAVSISGQVIDPYNRALSGVTVTLTDTNGAIRTTRTSSFGYYNFESVESGQNYFVNASTKRYRFDSQFVNVTDSLANVNFIGQPR